MIFGDRSKYLYDDKAIDNMADGEYKNTFSIQNPMLNSRPMSLYNIDLAERANGALTDEHDLFVPDVQVADNVCYDIKYGQTNPAPYFGNQDHHFRHTCVCLDGEDSYITFPHESLSVFYKQGLIVQTELLVIYPSDCSIDINTNF